MPDNSLVKVICLHRISDDIDYAWPPMKVNIFKRLLEYLGKNYNVIGFKQLADGSYKQSKKTNVILSFDDGYKDFVENALPLINAYGFPANHNIICNAVTHQEVNWTQEIFSIINHYTANGKLLLIKDANREILFEEVIHQQNALNAGIRILNVLFVKPKFERDIILANLKNQLDTDLIYPTFMNEADIRTCINKDIEIGSHTLSHCILSEQESGDVFQDEVCGSKKELEALLGTPIDTIALPNGYYDTPSLEKIRNYNQYQFVLTTDPENCYFQENESMSVIPRISLYHNNHYRNIARINLIDEIAKSWKEKAVKLIKG